ncbi:MAG: M20/M25/M40 family metallo-hydrolase [Clostridia bacterium]|nr:M20/M25/M40 family metallo-hydrolase [Clostridia bacterium]
MKNFRKSLSLFLALMLFFCCSVNAEAAFSFLGMRSGDVDFDGSITAEDARLILRAAVKLDSPAWFLRIFYDLDSDSQITSADARTALRIAVGLEELTENTSSYEKMMSGMLEGVSQKNLNSLMKKLCSLGSRSIIYPKNNTAAQQFITDELTSYGYEPSKQLFTYASIQTANIIATLNPGKSKDILLLCTHYDCWDGAEGAIDNASGVAAMLHVAKLLKESGIELNREVRFAFLSAEEYGYHGAYHYVSKLSSAERNRLIAFNVDMAGNSDLGGGRCLTVSTEPVSGSYTWREAKHNDVSKAIDKAKNYLGNIGEEKYYSPVAAGRHDSVPFRENGIPAVTLSWREIRSSGSYGSDYGLAAPSQIHTTLDTYENFNNKSLFNTTKLIFGSVLTLCAQ